MDGLKQSSISNINWTKAEKPYPKKSASLSSILNMHQMNRSMSNLRNDQITVNENNKNPFNRILNENQSEQTDNPFKSASFLNANNQKVSFKDLCDEDKQRIANLVKQLAKLTEEKKTIEESLEMERKQREAEIKEVLKQQEVLLNEKESLLNKLSKIQQKLIVVSDKQRKKNSKRCEAVHHDNEIKSNKLQLLYESQYNESFHNQLNQEAQQCKNELFNPHKSSTPRSLSPIQFSSTKNTESAENKKPISDENKKGVDRENLVNYEENENFYDLRKIELIKQQMELVEEQKMLKQLLDKQEEILKEKQEQIILQQKLHRERLEELSRNKFENLHIVDSIQSQAIEHKANQVESNKLLELQSQSVVNSFAASSTSIQNYATSIQHEKINLNNPTYKLLQSLVSDENHQIEVNSNNTSQYQSVIESNKISNQTSTLTNDTSNQHLQPTDNDYLIDLIIKQNESLNCSLNKSSQKMATKVKQIKEKSNKKLDQTNVKSIKHKGRDVLNADKLIEDLFFLK